MGHIKTKDVLKDVYNRLLDYYGPQHWWPADDPFEMMVGAVLTQNTSWGNVEKAIKKLKEKGLLCPDKIRTTPLEVVEEAVRSSGYYKNKAIKLKRLAQFLDENFNDDLEAMSAKDPWELRADLLSVWGIGPETADSIVLYAAGLPVLVVDAYTKRMLSRLGICDEKIDYAACQAIFMDNLPGDAALFNEFHGLIVRHSKDTCKKTPVCLSCPLLEICPSEQSGLPIGTGPNPISVI